jgi:S-DNA-T family DNA segregation ATPase FtsK/SpoIIIE
VVDASGSGFAKLLRTITLGLAATHSPDQLAFVFADWGTDTFLGLEKLPHTAALVQNLRDELTLLDRFSDALLGELSSRRRKIREASKGSLWDYQVAARARGADLPAIPSLLIVLNEFGKMLTAQPHLADLFAQIAREGTSLGVHLALEAIGVDFSYRIALRTSSAEDSRAVLDVPDAYELPAAYGRGYLKVPGKQVAYFAIASTDYPPRLQDVLALAMDGVSPTEPFWLPPLDESPSLDELLPARFFGEAGSGELTALVGIVDEPAQKRRHPLRLDLTRHLGIMGTTGSGTSTLLRTLVCSLALTRSPADVQFYCLDFGSGQLNALARLPHVACVASRHDTDLIRRMLAIVRRILDRRARFFASQGISTMSAYLPRRPSDDPYGEVFLVIDDLGVVRREFDDIQDTITEIANRGHVYGVHLVGTCRRSVDVRLPVQDAFGAKVELRLAEPHDSWIGRKAAESVPENLPGHGVVPPGLRFVGALPRIDGSHSSDDVDDGLKHLIDAVVEAWVGPPAPPVRLLPDFLSKSSLPGGGGRALRVPIGIDEDEQAPVFLDFETDPHFLVFGDRKCGKSNLLRSIVGSIVENTSPSEAEIVLLDYRRTLSDLAINDRVVGYAPTADSATAMLADTRQLFEGRRPTRDLTIEQLRAGSWWNGPERFVIVDDYQLLTEGGANPLAAITDLILSAKDVGLHLVVARTMSGAGRAMYDPVVQRMRDMGTPILIMSGGDGDDEGYLFANIRPKPLPQGRGSLITRSDPQLIQTALVENQANTAETAEVADNGESRDA